MKNLLEVKLYGKGVDLVPISLKYREECFSEFNSEITKYMVAKPSKKISGTDRFIKMSIMEMNEEKALIMAVINKEGEYLGNVGLHDINTKTPNLGIWIKVPAQGHNYGKEAITLLKEWADKNIDYDYIVYPVAKDNIPSRKIPESLGGKVTERYIVTLGGKPASTVEYNLYKKVE
jgi:[ribosomal protein S5]-alanine N-acetyltransferase